MTVKVGDKIKLIREVKNISTKHMADELNMSLGGYLKIERNDVDINTDKIEKIANILEVKPQDLLSDDKVVLNFNNNHFQNSGYNVNNFNFPEELKKLYEGKIQFLEEKNKFLEEKIVWLKANK